MRPSSGGPQPSLPDQSKHGTTLAGARLDSLSGGLDLEFKPQRRSGHGGGVERARRIAQVARCLVDVMVEVGARSQAQWRRSVAKPWTLPCETEEAQRRSPQRSWMSLGDIRCDLRRRGPSEEAAVVSLSASQAASIEAAPAAEFETGLRASIKPWAGRVLRKFEAPISRRIEFSTSSNVANRLTKAAL